MAWTLTLARIREDLAETRGFLDKIGGAGWKEQLGRGFRWLDEASEADRWLLEAASEYERSFTRSGLVDGSSLARVGGLMMLAGDPDSKSRLEASITGTTALTDPDAVAGVLYLLGRYQAASDAASGLESALATARLTADVQRVREIRADLLRFVRADRIGPHEESGHAPWSTWDWIEETFTLEAQLSSHPVPSHVEMLSATGLLKAKRATKRAPKLPTVGTSSDVRLLAGDGVEVTANATVDEDAVVLTLDPREDTWLMVTLDAEGGSWGANVQTHPEDGGEGVVDYDYASADEAADAVADWLSVNAPDPHDGAWAAASVRTLFAGLRS